MSEDPSQPIDNHVQHIILDTCILQYLSNKSMALSMNAYLSSLIERKYSLAISEISCAELLTNMGKKNEEDAGKVLGLFDRYDARLDFLIAAAQLSTIYHNVSLRSVQNIPIQADHILLGDLVLGATSVLSGSLLLTANLQDFPNPYFLPIEEFWLEYSGSKSSIKRKIYLQLLTPNYSLIFKIFSDRK